MEHLACHGFGSDDRRTRTRRRAAGVDAEDDDRIEHFEQRIRISPASEVVDAFLAASRAGDLTILLTTHYLDEAEKLCDRLAIMHEGRIVALDTPTALLASLGREIVELRVSGDAERALASLRSHGLVDGDGFVVGSTLTLPLHDRSAAEAVAAIGDAGVAASSISTRRPTLDDVYLRLTGGRLAEAA